MKNNYLYIILLLFWLIGFYFGLFSHPIILGKGHNEEFLLFNKPLFWNISYHNLKVCISLLFGFVTFGISILVTIVTNGYIFGYSWNIIRLNQKLVSYFFQYAIFENVSFLLSAKLGLTLFRILVCKFFLKCKKIYINLNQTFIEVIIILITSILASFIESSNF